MDSIFENVGAEAAQVEVAKGDAVTKDAKKERIEEMKAAIKNTIATNPDYSKVLRRLSDSLKVVNTLGFGKGGNIIVDKSKAERTLKETPAICGYKVENIGSEPIKYTTEVYTQDATGKFVGTVTEKVLAPGKTADLTRQYMTMLTCQPEFSFRLANGKIISGVKKKPASIKAELEAHYFLFNKEEDGTQLQVNDDEIKLSVDEEVGGKRVVKKAFVETFGYLNNEKEAKEKKEGSKFTTQDLAANLIATMLKEKGVAGTK